MLSTKALWLGLLASLPAASAQSSTVYQSGTDFNTSPEPTPPPTGCAVVFQAETTITEAWPTETDYNTIPAQAVCKCGQYGIAGVNNSTDQAGTVYVYCATGVTTFLSTNADLTVTPSANPTNPSGTPWGSVSCSEDALTSRSKNSTTQWEVAGASEAWEAVVQAWNLAWDQHATKSFVDFATDWFHTSPTNCGLMGAAGDSCQSYVNCGEGNSEKSQTASSPAAYMITNSFVRIHSIFNQVHEALADAQGPLANQVGSFGNTFSIYEQVIVNAMRDKNRVTEQLDIALAVFAVIMSLGFGVALPEAVGGGISGAIAAAVGGILYIEISLSFSLQELAIETGDVSYVQNGLSDYASWTMQRWQNATQVVASQLFNNTDALGKLINNGAMVADLSSGTSIDAEEMFTAAIFANTLSLAWGGGYGYGQPVIVGGIPGATCDTRIFDQYTDPGYPPKDFGSDEQQQLPVSFSADSDSLAADTCFINEEDGSPYWLIWAYKKNGPGVQQLYANFGIPPGPPSALDGSAAHWGGLSISNVTTNAIYTFKHNNYANVFGGNTSTPFDSPQDVLSYGNVGLNHAVGLVQIPVCSLQSVVDTMAHELENEHNSLVWPCPDGEDPNFRDGLKH